jgi:outer membrane receptor protein involved in Fe transport
VSHHAWRWIGVAWFLLAAPHLSVAQPAPSRLDQIVVTATRIAETAGDLPYATVSFDRRTLEEATPRTLPELLREESSIMVQKTALGQGSPFIRGFTGFRTMLLVDGFRLNNATFRDGPNQYWNTVDAWSLENLELVKGPTSAQYGSDAVGGTVHARTVRPRFDGEGKPVAFLTAAYRHATAEASHAGRGETGAGLGANTAFVAGRPSSASATCAPAAPWAGNRVLDTTNTLWTSNSSTGSPRRPGSPSPTSPSNRTTSGAPTPPSRPCPGGVLVPATTWSAPSTRFAA